jgi:hypothetical protein
MRISPSISLVVACTLISVSSLARAESDNPIFGQASVQKTSVSENKAVIGKGYYADLYGYYGNYYNAVAGQYGAQGSYYRSSSYYYNAYVYAGYAQYYYGQAYYNQLNGS